ncbi:cyclin-D3-1 [Ricinus communis]|uniref:cyclin-D3-1 n=1 Tax=Ricinus communis TaxID=3988 RepID=UPI00201AEE20|nr:cyclin-D3-1 [Ricinus communis]
MAIQQQQQQQQQQQHEQNSSFMLLDTLYCEEEKWEDEEQELQDEVCQNESSSVMCGEHYCLKNGTTRKDLSVFALSNLLEQDLFWEDGELLSLFSKEEEQKSQVFNVKNVEKDPSLSTAHQEAVEWMFKVNAHYGFSALTAILAVNYFDRFLFSSYYQRDKPWMIQLVAVTCLSIAAKVEETQVPLLLDLQVEDTKYVFEAKTIQRMELLVLSALKWKMHPVTPLSFLDHIIRRLGLKNHLHWEFLRRCERLLLTVVSDTRSISYLPSVLATATMMYVIDQVEPFNPVDYQNQLLGVLKLSKEKVNDCYELILELSKGRSNGCYGYNKSNKRKFEPMPSSPSGVIDAVFSCDSSNDSWALGGSAVVSSSPEPLFKKSRAQDQWVFVDIVGNSPR